MYSNYIYLAGSTAANILSDVVALLTGTTDIESLSASCDKANTTVNASVAAAGWELFDDAATATSKVIRAPLADNPTAYKYVQIDVSNTIVFLKTYESWNEVTHIGANTAYYSYTDTHNQRWSTSVAGSLHISASSRHIAMCTQYGTTIGNSIYGATTIVSEFSRLSPYDTVARGYPPFGFANGGVIYSPRIFNATSGSDDVSQHGSMAMGIPFPGASFSSQLDKVPDVNGTYTMPLWPIVCCEMDIGWVGGSITQGSGNFIFMTASSTRVPSAVGDEITANGENYVLLQAHSSNGSRLAVRKG